MRILVTGGAGFIASHITDTYIKAGHTVSVIDNLYHGTRRNLNPKVKFYKADIRKLDIIKQIIKREKPEIINHHAAISEVTQSMRKPLQTLDVNVTGTANLLMAASSVKIKKIIFASTGGTIYGNAKTIPTPETAPLQPLSMYALSKQLGEELIQYYAKTYKFSYAIFRYGNVFGERQDPYGEAGVIAIFSQLLHNKKTVTIFGDGTKTRDYIYIPDVVSANNLVLRHDHNIICNIGRGKPISDSAIYQTVRKSFPKALAPRFANVRLGEVMHSAIKSTLAKHVLNWKSQWSLTAGIADYTKKMNYV
ncbi:MAG: UDP-glucose 4-epimerase [uncultured bacterium]|nr:MAG: UDP-glucose 4-epimerase [uncultured bacterium]